MNNAEKPPEISSLNNFLLISIENDFLGRIVCALTGISGFGASND